MGDGAKEIPEFEKSSAKGFESSKGIEGKEEVEEWPTCVEFTVNAMTLLCKTFTLLIIFQIIYAQSPPSRRP